MHGREGGRAGDVSKKGGVPGTGAGAGGAARRGAAAAAAAGGPASGRRSCRGSSSASPAIPWPGHGGP